MDPLLLPGMRVMRRLGVAGKLGLVALVLLIPLSISIAGGFTDSNSQIRFAQHERDGLRYVQPLSRLMVQIGLLCGDLTEGRPASPTTIAALTDVDKADRDLGAELGVHEEWQALRAELTRLTGNRMSGPDALSKAQDAAVKARALITSVADSSNLILDPQLDSYYVMITLVDRLPRLVDAAASAQTMRLAQARHGGGRGAYSDRVELDVAVREVTGITALVGRDLSTAWKASESPTLQPASARKAGELSASVQDFAGQLTAPLRPPAGGDPGDLHLPRADGVAQSAVTLSDALVTELDRLLADRQRALAGMRNKPLLYTLGALALACYLFTALFRAVTHDVRRVLADIHTVTSGAIHQTEPLPGSDEFAQMSRAVVIARDRLTSLLGALRYQATHDDLTALGNRAQFTERLEEALDQGDLFAVVLLDLDGFKDVNDSFGHGTGDRLLRAAGARFHRVARRRDIVARLGGDEFAVLLRDLRSPEEAVDLVRQLHRSMEDPVELDGRRLRLRVSSGVALSSPGTSGVVELMRDADVAMYAAKDAGKGQSVVFEPHMHDRTRERTELSTDLAQALEAETLSMAYQPIVDLASGELHGVEALVRWEHPTRGSIPPSLFVPIAESSGLVQTLDLWVLRQSAQQLAAWQRAFPDQRPITMEVNLSAAHLDDEHLVEDIVTVLSDTGIDPSTLVIEITESALVTDIDTALRRLAQLSALGVRLALDDFGTGYSSLSYLRRLPISILKIDKSFVDDIGGADGEARAMLRSIVELARALGLQTVAEGIEEDHQAAALREMGCHLGQGYLFARPLDPAGMAALLGRQRGWVPRPRTTPVGPPAPADPPAAVELPRGSA